MTVPSSTPTTALDGLTGALADIVCWMAFYLHECEDEEVDLEVADELTRMLGEALRRLPVKERLRFVEHAAARSATSKVANYQEFLIGIAESLGLE